MGQEPIAGWDVCAFMFMGLFEECEDEDTFLLFKRRRARTIRCHFPVSSSRRLVRSFPNEDDGMSTHQLCV